MHSSPDLYRPHHSLFQKGVWLSKAAVLTVPLLLAVSLPVQGSNAGATGTWGNAIEVLRNLHSQRRGRFGGVGASPLQLIRKLRNHRLLLGWCAELSSVRR